MIKHNRRSIRLPEYDYSQAGLYFITICTHDRLPWFGHVDKGLMHLNEYGLLADQHWQALPDRFPTVVLAEHQIMPNHLHGVIQITDETARNPSQTSPTVGQIVGAYKSLVAKASLSLFCQRTPNEQMGKIWQRNYYEHIIRHETAYQRIAAYIVDNPSRWSEDMFYNAPHNANVGAGLAPALAPDQ